MCSRCRTKSSALSFAAIEPELLRHERERAARAPQQNATAYELFQRGQWHHYRYTKEDNLHGRAYFRQALAIDPNYAQAAATLSITLGVAVLLAARCDELERRLALERCFDAILADGLAFHQAGVPSGTARCFAPSAKAKLAAAAADRS